MGIATYVDRFWTSDSIDALDRLEIQKGVTKLIPLEMLGSHIGSPTCHTTGRKHALSFRGATAMFGWLGVEWNLLTLNEREREKLAHVISVYKQFRALLHTGNYIRHDHPDNSMHIHSVVASDAGEALVSVSRLHNGPSHRTAPLLVTDLSPNELYSVQRIDLGAPRWALHRGLPDWVNNGVHATGAQLAHIGLVLPPLLPESTMLLHITQVSK
jgi:alpha-galactosidase